MTATAETFEAQPDRIWPLSQPDVEFTGPGVYPGIPDELYHRDQWTGEPSLSASGAKKLLPPSCPAIFKWERDHPPAPKKEFDFGHAAHRMVLGVGADLQVVEGERWDTKVAKAAVAEARAAGRVPLKEKDMAQVEAMARKLREDPIAAKLLKVGSGTPEASLYWRDDETHVLERSRIDFLPNEVSSGGRLIVVDYKGLPLETPLPTPTGWTTMDAVAVGDELFDLDGRRCRVTGKSSVHLRDCYRITFDDASSVVCDGEHRWVTHTTRAGNRGTDEGVRTTVEIRQTLRKYGQRQHRVPVARPLDLPRAKLPVDPYVLGCWLGDGTTASGRITCGDRELFDNIVARGYEVGTSYTTCPTLTVKGLAAQLRSLHLLGHKHIPDVYLRSSHAQRLELLRGLMDTDGSWNDARRQAVFTSVDKALAVQVRELACSLGQRAILQPYTAHGYGITREAYRVTFTPIDLNPFALMRKARRVRTEAPVTSRQRIVISVDPVPTVPTQCIEVDSPSRTYLCTEAMIPTHNSAESADPQKFARNAYDYGYDIQAAKYVKAVRALELAEDAAFLFVVQQKTAPYLVSVVQLDSLAMRIGEHRNRKALRIFNACMTADHWPTWSDDVELVSLPGWAVAEYESETA